MRWWLAWRRGCLSSPGKSSWWGRGRGLPCIPPSLGPWASAWLPAPLISVPMTPLKVSLSPESISCPSSLHYQLSPTGR
jgi:hypothetical protein